MKAKLTFHLALAAAGLGILLWLGGPAGIDDGERSSFIVQAESLDMAATAVGSIGGEITHELGIIRSVGAKLAPPQAAKLGERDGVLVYENRTVETSSVCTVDGEPNLSSTKNKILWDLTNSGGVAATIDRIEVTWPVANKKLKKIKFDGDDIFKTATVAPSALIDSGWESDLSRRILAAGQTKAMQLEFEAKNAVTDTSRRPDHHREDTPVAIRRFFGIPSSSTAAEYRFEVLRSGLEAGDYLSVQAASVFGGSNVYTEIGRIEGPADDVDFTAVSFDASAHISATMNIRLVPYFQTLDGTGAIYVDTVEVAFNVG